MGKIEDGYVRGLVGSTISRRVGNLNVLQGSPRFRVKQTEATKAAGTDFGTASRCARMIRYAFWSLILDYQDGGMINRLNAQVLRAMRANRRQQTGTMQLSAGKLHRLVDFQFNAKCHLQDYLFVDIVVEYTSSGNLDVIIPAFHSERDLLWSGDMTHCSIQLLAVAFDFEGKAKRGIGRREYIIPLRTREKDVLKQHWHFDVAEPAGTVILVGLSLEFMYNMGSRFHLLNNKELHPAAIVGAFVV
ncbi:hypothetical protein [Parapedobacter koreensis]|uniref:Uncharacterized protein n=1 Tax=Parapedobacter koreensis TaxID=332977 RepID=A0A1H7N0W3_9SPHI|nr:hypothetical protein [Parapedobacter koreensis]SEL17074.1 hypothetical protein SAMN05421740_103712 [Parapedobacter koreensis]